VPKAPKAERIASIEGGKRSVDGNESRLMHAAVADGSGRYVITVAMFSHQGFGWALNLRTTPDQSERLRPLFRRTLECCRMSDSSKVV
jgi:hypothetical protein